MENKSNIIAAVDIGTTKIVAIAGTKNDSNRYKVIGFGTTSSKGIRRGVVLNIDETVNSIKQALNKMLLDSDITLDKVYIGIAGQHVRTQQNRGIIEIKDEDKTITYKHVDELIDKMRNSMTNPGEEIIDIIPHSYIVNNKTDIKNPVGMEADTLEGNFHIIMGKISMVNNIKKCATLAGLNVNSLVLEPLASAEAVLTDAEKQKGVAMIDIGGGTTDIAVFKENKIVHTAVIPIGGNTITNDIKISLSILDSQAEELKIQYGSAIEEKSQEETIISIERLNGREEKEFSLRKLSGIIQARMEEILHAVMFQIESAGIEEKLAGGIVITGGGSLLKNLKQLASYITGYDVRIAYPTEYVEERYSEYANKPQYATAIGLIMKGFDIESAQQEKSIYDKINQEKEEVSKVQNNANFIDKLKNKMAKLFDEEEN